MTVEYLDLADYVSITTEVTGLEAATVMKVANLDLADSALHAPAAGFGDTEFYPDFVDKAAVLIVRLAKNHSLPDGNKRVAWVALRLFVEINGWLWSERRRSTRRSRLCSPSRRASGTRSAQRNGSASTWCTKPLRATHALNETVCVSEIAWRWSTSPPSDTAFGQVSGRRKDVPGVCGHNLVTPGSGVRSSRRSGRTSKGENCEGHRSFVCRRDGRRLPGR